MLLQKTKFSLNTCELYIPDKLSVNKVSLCNTYVQHKRDISQSI